MRFNFVMFGFVCFQSEIVASCEFIDDNLMHGPEVQSIFILRVKCMLAVNARACI